MGSISAVSVADRELSTTTPSNAKVFDGMGVAIGVHAIRPRLATATIIIVVCILQWLIMAPDSITLDYRKYEYDSRNKGRIAMPYTRRYNPATSLGDFHLTFPLLDPIDMFSETIAIRSIGSYFRLA
jgi:hypothetical protein